MTNIFHYFFEHIQFFVFAIFAKKEFPVQSYFFLFCTFFFPLHLAKDFQLFGYEPQLSNPQHFKFDLPFGAYIQCSMMMLNQLGEVKVGSR